METNRILIHHVTGHAVSSKDLAENETDSQTQPQTARWPGMIKQTGLINEGVAPEAMVGAPQGSILGMWVGIGGQQFKCLTGSDDDAERWLSLIYEYRNSG